MRKLLVFTLGSVLLCLGAAPALGAGGPAIPGGAFGGHGVTGPPGLPSSDYRYVALSVGGTTLVEKIKTDSGVVSDERAVDGLWALPAVTLLGGASGLSADGSTLVLIRPVYGLGAQRTTMRILDADSLRTSDRIHLDTRASFDAISPDGGTLYLIQYTDPRDPLDYRVRAFDVATEKFEPGAIVDPDEPDEKMTGQPMARVTSADGRWAYTLYAGGEETFIHALDTQLGVAQCIDLDQFGPKVNAFELGLNVAPEGGALTVTDAGDAVATVDPQTFTVSEIDPAAQAPTQPVDDQGDGSSWIGWGALAAGITLVAGLALALRRRRRAADGVDEEALERLVKMDADERERDREPVR